MNTPNIIKSFREFWKDKTSEFGDESRWSQKSVEELESLILKALADRDTELVERIEKTQGECIKDPFDNEHEYFSKAQIIKLIKDL